MTLFGTTVARTVLFTLAGVYAKRNSSFISAHLGFACGLTPSLFIAGSWTWTPTLVASCRQSHSPTLSPLHLAHGSGSRQVWSAFVPPGLLF